MAERDAAIATKDNVATRTSRADVGRAGSQMSTLILGAFVVLVVGILAGTLLNERELVRLFKLDQHFDKESTLLDGVTATVNTAVEDLKQQYAEAFADRVGLKMKEEYHAFSPVLLLPGITSTALELWQGKECASEQFRKKFWGSESMMRNFVRNASCWLEHLGLSNEWDDPENIVLRASEGFSASDFLFPGYFVWAKMLENLRDVGYEPRNMHLLAYDWRQSLEDLESKEAFWEHMAGMVERLRNRNHARRVYIVSHSMGGVLAHYFIHWASHHKGDQWITDNVEGWINIAGPLLGVPKTISAVLSGEMRDTAEFGMFSKQVIGAIFGNDLFVRFFRSLGSLPSMFPSGSPKVWQAFHKAPLLRVQESMKEEASTESHSEATKNVSEPGSPPRRDMILDEPLCKRTDLQETVAGSEYSTATIYELLGKVAPRYFALVQSHYAHGSSGPETVGSLSKKWFSSEQNPLPGAAELKITCMYGVLQSHTTEVGYEYSIDADADESATLLSINTSVSVPEFNLTKGIYNGRGDGTVPWASMVYPCLKWKYGGLLINPARLPVSIREYLEDPSKLSLLDKDYMRGGKYSVGHVEIIANMDVMRDVIKLVSLPLDKPEAKPTLLEDVFATDANDIFEKLHPGRKVGGEE
ncbi:Phospholipid:diacylglycerol acyltransferase [Porphyridium purpureum]|uniref:Phospholipid:diacylglycerol acyltransferase n=1 Tax=Porphyridium purpureum TaxID=35688 RepID=A0A5J4YUI0_PORPP|nr:Phospholipid:diacylglycerol acyltransferase [Porphyridium purpureum]|eukprot:POR9493..scf227_4